MNILNITFNSIHAEKSSMAKGKVGISSNISLENMEDSKMGLDKTKTALKISFLYNTAYSPDFAKIELKGDSIVLVNAEDGKKMLAGFKKDKVKSLDKKFALKLINTLMIKCSLQAIIMAKELALPSPIPLPKIKFEEEVPAKK